MAKPNFANLLSMEWRSDIPRWLREDTPSLDYSGFVVGSTPTSARLLAKSPGILAGVPFFTAVFEHLHCLVAWHLDEGDAIPSSSSSSSQLPLKLHVATVTGPVNAILLGERIALNILARCSGIATESRALRDALDKTGYKGLLAGTRKTTPGFRVYEKYAMLVGGADTHRMDLSAMIMLKDNHVWAVGSVAEAVARARSVSGFALKIEVEARTEEEADEAVGAGADVVMLDNFSPEEAHAAAERLKAKWAGKREFMIEVSGGLRGAGALEYASPHIDILSTSSIHQGVPHVDFSLKIDK